MNIQSNEARCTSCHAGYGWKDTATFDFSDPHKIDCLVCHEQTGTYKKFPAGAGYPADKETFFPGDGETYYPPDWKAVAQSVGRPTRANCGTCHFYGGGGDGVKHGDLDSSMFKPAKALDVHMGVDGQNFDCVRCHTTAAHDIAGRIYSNPAATERKSLLEDDQIPRIMCESCHSAAPHKANAKANDHTDKVACQSCHIPEFARALPTKMSWDWSTAGRLKDGKPVKVKGPLGKESYNGQKGDFVWAMNVAPEYFWFNGVIESVRATDRIDDSGVVKLAWPEGSPDDPNSRIMPFKVHRGKTPYDTVNKNMVVPKLFGKDPAAYWTGYDWGQAIAAGMAKVGLPYSGEYGFVQTEWVYPTTHMVAPKDKTLACGQCHSRQGRLAKLGGFYMPGRDYASVVDFAGWGGAALSLIGVSIHGLMRLFSRNGRKED